MHCASSTWCIADATFFLIHRSYYASFVPGLAAGGAAGMLFRGFPAQGAPQPMTPFLVPFAPGPPSWSVAFEDSAALAADLAASDACRVSFPANVGGNPVPAYYPATFTARGSVIFE